MSSLTEEQRLRMERNRQEALRKRAAKIPHQDISPIAYKSDDTSKKLKLGESSNPSVNFYRSNDKNGKSVSDDSRKPHYNKKRYSGTLLKKELVTGHCKLIKRDRFNVDVGYHSDLIQTFKSIPQSAYDPISKTWSFSLSDHGKLMAALSSLKGVSVSPLPKVVLETFLSPRNSMDSSFVDLSKIDPVLIAALMPFQLEGVRFGILRDGRCLIADEMGLGKTIQALGIAHYFKADWPLLIVCPSSVKYTWREAIGNWLPSIAKSGEEVVVISTSKESLTEGAVLIMSTDMFSKCGEKLSRFQTIIVWKHTPSGSEGSHEERPRGIQLCYAMDLFVHWSMPSIAVRVSVSLHHPQIQNDDGSIKFLFSGKLQRLFAMNLQLTLFHKITPESSLLKDESHSLKNSKSVRSQVAFKVLRKTKRVILLSGTPALSRPSELYHQLTCIDRVGFPRMVEFGIRYCNGKNKRWGWDFSGATNMEELVLLLKERVMIRRLKSEVMEQLPAKTRELIILDRSAVNNSSKEMSTSLKNFKSKQNMKVEGRSALLEYYSVSGKAKMQAVCNYIEDILEDDIKFICFAHHKIVLNGICEVLQENGISYIRIDGSTPAHTRKELCDEFQLSEKCRVAVLSITAANTGLTLSAASLIIFAELFWNPGILAQAEDRAHRIGQKSNVVVRYLVAEKTADDYLWPMLQEKLEVLNQMGLSKESVIDADCTHQKGTLQREITDFFQDMIEDFDIP